MDFNKLGLNRFLYDIDDKSKLGRVSAQYRDLYRIITEEGEIMATLSGKSYHKADKSEFPVVGDWVLFERYNRDSQAQIKEVLDRQSQISRNQAGKKDAEQIIAANIDIIFIVTSLNQDFNKRRLERYLTIAWDSGAKPIIILNKSDLCNNIEHFKNEIEDIAFGTEYIVSSCVNDEGIVEIQKALKPDKTAVLIGSSGVGKSSIINLLLGEKKQSIEEIREDDARGRHTTTNRELFLLPEGGVIIDTPGMREIQLWVDEDSLETVFSEIEQLASDCKFNDCSHTHEPGCAVKNAVQNGELSKDRLDNYCKMKREIKYQKLKEKYNAKKANKIKWQNLMK
jgi:ribosome biogenesis GTPase